MNTRTLGLLLGLGLACPLSLASQSPARALEIEEFLSLDRVADPQISPDGRWVTYTVITTDVATNRRSTDVWFVATSGGAPRRVSDGRLGGSGARWSPDGATIAYVTTREGTPHVRLYTLRTGRSRRLVGLSGGAGGIVWSPKGTHIAFASEVYPECTTDACNAERTAAAESAGSKARVYEELLYRHWSSWFEGRRSHVFVADVAAGATVDVVAGKDFDVPVPPFGGSTDYAFTADGTELLFITKLGADQAWHTNTDVYRVPITGGEPRLVTAGMRGGESHPAPSPDGTMLAFLSQERPGFESDRWRLMIRDEASGRVRELLRNFDLSVSEYLWMPDSRGILFTAERRQRTVVFRVGMDGRVDEVTSWGNSSAISLAGDGAALAMMNDAIHRPGQVHVLALDAREPPRALTSLNAERLRDVVLHPAEEISWVGAEGHSVYGLLVRPPQFRRGERYPLLVLIHGGPQGSWLDNFHSRWNAQMFAARGYVTVLLNPRGSTGFGQSFVDHVSKDWGGRVYIDIMSGVEHAARFPFVDSTRIAAAGGSYGGYMVNWINAHSRRFDALIAHAGVYNLESMYGSTEELWFPEWEFGAPPWENRTLYEQWSPHRFAQHLRTPTLVLHGALDFRVPDTQAFELFTALRRQRVPARLVHFPDEGHWISRPQNQLRWWTQVHEWLATYLTPSVP